MTTPPPRAGYVCARHQAGHANGGVDGKEGSAGIMELESRVTHAPPRPRSLPPEASSEASSSSVVVEGPLRGVRWAGWSCVPTGAGRLVRQLPPGSIEAGPRGKARPPRSDWSPVRASARAGSSLHYM
ncbi:hypothetical protein PRIPAC_83953, partial [Pristionchus pacificus]